jgi:hypothetical protein
VSIEGGEVRLRTALHGVAWRLKPGHVLELELTTGSTQYSIPRTGPFAVDLTATARLPMAPAA